ncbi:MAG: superoxide dismutase family protein [Bacillota bacterium]|jgi:Cu-Zn family superoxide dismutase
MNEYSKSNLRYYSRVLQSEPQAWAEIKGSTQYPDLSGMVYFFRTPLGVLTAADIYGLPQPQGQCQSPVFGFHIHEGTACTGNDQDPFADAKMHYNPNNCPHPRHAGDLPPLFGNAGHGFSVFLTNRFQIPEIIGKTIIIHSRADDFTTQPSGNSGSKIACGVICRTALD